MAATKDKTVIEVIKGVELYESARSRFYYYRIWDKATQKYLRRSTGQDTVEKAREWVIENLQELFQIKPAARGGGSNSLIRLIGMHLEHEERRVKAGVISDGTLLCYQKCGRHFLKWLKLHGYKKVSDIKRKSFVNYGLNRVNDDGMAVSTANLEIVYFNKFWKYLQDEEIVDREISMPKLKEAISNKTSGEPFEPDDLKAIHRALVVFKDDRSDNITDYNREVFVHWIQTLEESGVRQHEIAELKWKDVKIGETRTNRKRIINTITIPHTAKRGFRKQVYRGSGLINLRQYQYKIFGEISDDDYVFRNEDSNVPIDRSTFARYWYKIQDISETNYVLHTFRSYRITQLLLNGTDIELVSRNLAVSIPLIMKTYMKYNPAAHFDKLVQKDQKPDSELRDLISAMT